MVSPPETRLGIHGVEEIKKHPYFKGIDWNNIRKMKAPFIPELKNDYDTHYFDTFLSRNHFILPILHLKGNKEKMLIMLDILLIEIMKILKIALSKLWKY